MSGPRATLRTTVIAFVTAAAMAPHAAAIAGSVYVEHVGPLEVSSYRCREVERSTVVRETCHQRETGEMVVQLNASWYRYCDVPTQIMTSWHRAPSMGRFFTERIRGRYNC